MAVIIEPIDGTTEYPPTRPWEDLLFPARDDLIVDVPWDFPDEAFMWVHEVLGQDRSDFRFYIATNGGAMRYQMAFADEEAMSRFVLTWM